MVSLEDLAVMYLRQGRTAEVKQLAEEMVAVFHCAAHIRQVVARRANGMV